VTYRSSKCVVDEMEYLLKKYDISGFKIFDSTFTINKRHVESICDEIISRGLTFPWECEIRVSGVDKSLLEKMKRAGCYLVDYGIESLSPKVLKLMHKGINRKQIDDVLGWCHELGIQQRAFFSFGHIGESMEDAEMTLNFIREHLNQLSLLSIGVGIRIYPGTEVEKYALVNKYLENFSWSLPYRCEKNVLLNLPENIPTLIQPQFGWGELYEINRQVLSLQASNPRFILRRMVKSHSKEDLKRYMKILRRYLKSKLN
jgi:radical SAM superfamily enzyme YgiQ (UPF0313 family)